MEAGGDPQRLLSRRSVFFDETRQALCGVIDFGDLTIEDAATDLKSILEDLGEDVL
jgi:Ser/Thr protein kinase RdoA (MazF antagonist)